MLRYAKYFDTYVGMYMFIYLHVKLKIHIDYKYHHCENCTDV